MQNFIPYANPKKTRKCLDLRRLNKQILETLQMLSANTGIDIGWKIPKYIYNHPCTLLWKNDTEYLMYYLDNLLTEFMQRRCKFHKAWFKFHIIEEKLGEYYSKLTPKHLTPEFCKKHQELLLSKDFNYYSKYFLKGY